MEGLSTAPAIEREEGAVPVVLPWVYDGARIFFDWLLGDPDLTRPTLERAVAGRSASYSASRATLLMEGGVPCGGFIGIGGADLAACRTADTLAVMRAVGPDGRPGLLDRRESVDDPPPAVGPDECYLRGIGTLPEHRGRGLGRVLVEKFLSSGREAGFSRFRLEVVAANEPAVRLFRAMGFEESHRAVYGEGAVEVLSMARERGDP